MPLTDARVRNARSSDKPLKISDGGGLYLMVTPIGAKLWRLAYRYAGKQKTLALGVYPTVSLDEAREARGVAKKLLQAGGDPSEAKKVERRNRRLSAANTFGIVADEWVAKLRREGRSPSTITKTEWLLSFAKPLIGSRPISELSSSEILDVLRRVESRGRLESARRLRSTIGSVFRYAIATTRAENDPTIALRGSLTTPLVKHRAAVLEPKALGALLRSIDGFEGQPATRAALQLMALLFPRPGELRAAEWCEFNFEAAIWTIPAKGTKMRREHRVPLPAQAIDILRVMRDARGGGQLLFPSLRSAHRPMSENAMNAALRRLGYAKDEATAHGFRATASTLLNEAGCWKPDVIERQLGHIEKNDVRRAYARGEYWDDRVRMMQWWGAFLDDLRVVGQVIPMRNGLDR